MATTRRARLRALRAGASTSAAPKIVGTMSGSKLEVDLGALVGKRLRVHGAMLRSRSLEEKATLTQEFAPYSFTFTTPPRGDAEGNDLLGIRPVAPDKRRVMEVRSIRIHAVGPKVKPPTPADSVLPPG